MTDALVVRLAIAALIGLAVGIERERSGHAPAGPEVRFAGVRTFVLLGSVGGIAGWLADLGPVPVAAALVGGGALLSTVAYWAASRAGPSAIDGTTEVAALLVLALGVVAGLGELGVAGGGGAITALALSEKATIRTLVARLDVREVRAAFLFAVLALVILPVLPNETFGPLGGVNPRTLWIVVLIFSGINFAGWAARRAVGESRGYGVTGALGGLISSTAVTLQFARLSVGASALSTGLGIGVIAACTVLIPRILVVSAALEPAVALLLIPFLLPPLLAGVAVTGLQLARSRGGRVEGTPDLGLDASTSPLGLWSAMKLALAFQAALMAIAYVRESFGPTGVLASAALLGLTDMDALTLSMNRLGTRTGELALAARAIAVGIAANSLLKLTMALVLGSPSFRRVAAPGLLALLLTSLGTLLLVG